MRKFQIEFNRRVESRSHLAKTNFDLFFRNFWRLEIEKKEKFLLWICVCLFLILKKKQSFFHRKFITNWAETGITFCKLSALFTVGFLL